MERITFPGQRISTFPNIVAHVGLKVQPQQLLIDSTSLIIFKAHPQLL